MKSKRKDLVSFGNYLLSKRQKTRNDEGRSQWEVTHADVENWLHEQPKRRLIEKRRTQEQIDEAVANGDYAGGYETFIGWMIYMRTWIFPTMALLITAIIVTVVTMDASVWYAVAEVVVMIIIILSLIKDFRDSKKGIST